MRVAVSSLLQRSAQGLAANFYAADALAQRQFRAATRRHAERVVRVARVYCAVHTGFMRDHLGYWLTPSELVADIGWRGEDFFGDGLPFYPPYVEFGTSRAPAQPALLPAFHAMEPQYLEELGEIGARALARMLRRAA